MRTVQCSRAIICEPRLQKFLAKPTFEAERFGDVIEFHKITLNDSQVNEKSVQCLLVIKR